MAQVNDLMFSAENTEMVQYTKHAPNVVTFRIVRDLTDIESPARKSNSFQPLMTHQIFGDSEMIFGYRELSIQLYYLHNSAKCYLELQTGGKVVENELYKADDLNELLNPWLPEGYCQDKAEFVKELAAETHCQMFGEVVGTFNVGNRENKYLVTLCDTTDAAFREFHQRYETLIIWFIDGANFIDLDDSRWTIYYVYERSINENTKKEQMSPIGFCTVYKFFLYPNSTRARISQFFVLPTHQRKGIATNLYMQVFNHMKSLDDVTDVTVEEPTQVFQKIRDYCDSLTIYKHLSDNDINITTQNQKQINELLRKNKICKRQAQRVFDILECMISHKNGYQEYVKFTESIKTRISNDYERENRGSKRLCNVTRDFAIDQMNKKAIIEGAYNKYIDSLEWPVNRLRSKVSI